LTVDLHDRVALVTGASSGLGGRFARVLANAGATVVATARRADRLNELAEATGATTVAADLATADGRQAVIDAVGARHNRLDVLVNNAGTADSVPLEEATLDDLEAIVDVNLVAVLDLCRLAAPLLLASARASVINVSSVYGLVSSRAAMPAYNATKGALVQLTRHLATQWGGRGVRVNALAPGYFPTELTGMLTDPVLVNAIQKRTALHRPPDLEELDGPLLFLASDQSSYVTGQVLAVDGGWTAT
jgi:NAD(P)-dependent dehydrogenase (short-subunit alcohol dehydrogenase family)